MERPRHDGRSATDHRDAVGLPAQFDAVLEPLRAALDACGARGPFASVAWGRPEPDDGQWLDLDAFALEEGAAPAIRRYPSQGDSAKLIGHWVFQNASGTALLAAGYLYAAQRRVPVLQGNTLIHNTQWLQHLRLVQPRLRVLPDDLLAGAEGVTTVDDHQALTAALFAEVQGAYEPIVQAFRARRQVSIANAWASVVDGLLQGFLLAGGPRLAWTPPGSSGEPPPAPGRWQPDAGPAGCSLPRTGWRTRWWFGRPAAWFSPSPIRRERRRRTARIAR